MLDYILSRMVLLSFLLLILGLLVAYQGVLANFFLSGSAKGVAVDLGEKIRSVALNLATSTEVKKIQLPPTLEAGPLRSSYKIRLGCKKDGQKVILGIGVKNPRGDYLYVYRIDLYLPGKDISVSYYAADINAGDIIQIKKEVSPSKVNLYIQECGKNYTCNSPLTTTGGSCS